MAWLYELRGKRGIREEVKVFIPNSKMNHVVIDRNKEE
jgi:hypothetical protein